MHAIKPVSEGSPSHSAATERQLQTTPRMDTKTWLTMVVYHSENGSSEGMRSLNQLAQSIPEYDTETTPEMQEVVDQIRGIAESKCWNPKLSPTSSKALSALTSQPSPAPQERKEHPKCRKQLFFDDKDI